MAVIADRPASTVNTIRSVAGVDAAQQRRRCRRVAHFDRRHDHEPWYGFVVDDQPRAGATRSGRTSDPRRVQELGISVIKPHEWPDEIANSVEAVDLKRGKVKLVSKATARRTILEVTGKVKGEAGVDQLVDAMRQTLERNTHS